MVRKEKEDLMKSTLQWVHNTQDNIEKVVKFMNENDLSDVNVNVDEELLQMQISDLLRVETSFFSHMIYNLFDPMGPRLYNFIKEYKDESYVFGQEESLIKIDIKRLKDNISDMYKLSEGLDEYDVNHMTQVANSFKRLLEIMKEDNFVMYYSPYAVDWFMDCINN